MTSWTSTIMRRVVGLVAGLALALGMTAGLATTAEAKKTVWDRVAACESGGRWKINSGNGYYGGLQFSSRTWSGHGGKKYASKANKASKAEQIAIARRVLHSQGAGAWPSCGRKAGLTKSNGKAAKRATPSSNPGVKKSNYKKSTKAATKKATAKAKAKAKDKAKAKAKATSKAGKKKTIKVRSGDTLAKIAKRYHVKGGWKAVWKLNTSRLKNPNHLKVGQRLVVRKK